MWDPSATPQDPDMLVHTLEGPVAQNFRPADACRRHFVRAGYSLELSVLDTHGNDIEAPRLAFAPALDVKIDAACPRHFMRGLASLELSVLDTHGNDIEAPRLAFAPALDVKIDAAPGRKFDPLSN